MKNILTLDYLLHSVPAGTPSHSSNYLCTNTENLLIFNDLKIGSRTIKDWFNTPSTKITIETTDFKRFLPKEPNTEILINNILSKISIQKDILLIYRNPFRKTITGLLEDFLACIQVEKLEDGGLFFEIYSNVENNIFKKIIRKHNGNVHSLFNWDCSEDMGISTSQKVELFSTLFLEFLKIKKETGGLFEKHSTPMCYSTYQLIKECLDDTQKFYLFDLDDKDISLENFLERYKTPPKIYSKLNTSNISHFSKFTDWFKEHPIHEYLTNLLHIEYNFYLRLKSHQNNIKNKLNEW